MIHSGGNPAVTTERRPMSFADLCLFLGALFAFATLVVKVIKVSRKWAYGRGPTWQPGLKRV